MFTLYEPVPILEKAPLWTLTAKNFSELFGHSPFADLFLRDPTTGQVALLITERAAFFEIECPSMEEFCAEFLKAPAPLENLFRRSDHDFLVQKLGALGKDECFFAVPYTSIGGSGELETYQKGNIWAHLDIFGQTLL